MNTQLMHAARQSDSPLLPRPRGLSARQMMICLGACMALQMTSFVMILPLFARRFGQLGAGVGALGTSEVAYALAAAIAAPFMGALADRFGRRLLVLFSLAACIGAFTGYLLAASAFAFVLLRALAGALTAGLVPAATGMVADLAPQDRRAQWIGILSGAASVGWIAGPIFGGLLYDRWGYAAALLVSIGMAAVAFTTALATLRETRSPLTRRLARASARATAFHLSRPRSVLTELRATLPVALTPFIMVLITYLGVMFAYAFIEPRLMFYAYDDLGWNSSMLGFAMSTYGIALMLGEFGLGQLSDRIGRKPVIVIGLVLFSAQFLGLALSRSYIWIAVAFVIAGLGNALFDPALSASILDMVPAEHQARVLGVKGTAGSMGSILGPALAVLFAPLLQAKATFLIATFAVLLLTLLGIAGRMEAKPREHVGYSSAAGAPSVDPRATARHS